MNPEQWKTSLDLGTIATAMLVIAITFLLWTSSDLQKRKGTRKK